MYFCVFCLNLKFIKKKKIKRKNVLVTFSIYHNVFLHLLFKLKIHKNRKLKEKMFWLSLHQI